MKAIRVILTIIGALTFLMGFVWMGQGSGVFPYPASSPMINQSPWIWRGALLVVAGIVVFLIGRRIGRR